MTKKLIIIAAIATALFQSCGDGFKTSEDGLKYKIHTTTDGEKIKLGDFVTLNMVYRTDSDSVLFDTYKVGQAVKLMVSAPSFKGDLMHGLTLLAEGDSATILINADSLFEKTFQFQRPAFIAAGSMLTFNLKIEKVQSKEKMEEEMKLEMSKKSGQEKENIEKYIADNKLTMTTTTSGLQYVINKAGSSEKAMNGDTVVVNYTGRLLNGQKFDSSLDGGKPFEFVVGSGEVIKGWDEAFLILGKGSKAFVLIPSSLAWGPSEAGNGKIPAFSTVVFDLELLNIKKAKK